MTYMPMYIRYLVIQLLDELKNSLLEQLSIGDSFNLMYSNFAIQKASTNWIPGDSLSIVSAFNTLNNQLADYLKSFMLIADPLAKSFILDDKFDVDKLKAEYRGGVSAKDVSFGYQFATARRPNESRHRHLQFHYRHHRGEQLLHRRHCCSYPRLSRARE